MTIQQPKHKSIIEAASKGEALSAAIPADQREGTNELPNTDTSGAPSELNENDPAVAAVLEKLRKEGRLRGEAVRTPRSTGKMTSGAKFVDW